jgi:hypothetical protein
LLKSVKIVNKKFDSVQRCRFVRDQVDS